MTNAQLMFWITGTLCVVSVCVESWFSWRFLSALKKRYPDLWAHAGYRDWKTDGSLISAWPTITYLWQRDYLEREQPEEIAFCEAYRLKVVVSWAASVLVSCVFLGVWVMTWKTLKTACVAPLP